MEKKRPVYSLFSGAGGLDLGFTCAGFQPLVAVDHNASAVRTYRRNHPDVRVEQRDLAHTNASELIELWQEVSDISPVGVIGGPPCQAFSQGNVYQRDDDVRRILPLRYAELLKELNVRFDLHFFVFENVIGLGHTRNETEYSLIKNQFRRAGFTLFEGILDAQHFGVPQRRRRLFIVGLNRNLYPDAKFDFPQAPLLVRLRTVHDAIAGLPEPVFFDRSLLPEEIPHHPNHWTMQPRSAKFRDPMYKLGSKRGRSFRVLDWHEPSLTVAYGNREIHVHPTGHRRLSIFEAMLLQGFPNSYVLEGTLSAQVSQVGDAVPPPVAEALGTAVRAFLDSSLDHRP